MPEMPAAQRGSDPDGNRQYATVRVWCLWCKPGKRVLIGTYRQDRATAATTDHIERHHPENTPPTPTGRTQK